MEIVQKGFKGKIEAVEPTLPVNYHAEGAPACCGNCPHWFSRADLGVKTVDEHITGECRFDPPKNMPMPAIDRLGQQQIAITAFFPAIRGNGWCGHHPDRLPAFKH